jgi:hypothetical protein
MHSGCRSRPTAGLMKKPRPMSTSPSSTLLRTAVTSTSWRFTRTCGCDAAKALVTPGSRLADIIGVAAMSRRERSAACAPPMTPLSSRRSPTIRSATGCRRRPASVSVTVPAAVASTLVTNPLTFGPIYDAAWQVGDAILGTRQSIPPAPAPATAPAVQAAPGVEAAPAAEAKPAAEAAPDALDEAADDGWWRGAVRRVLGVGKPLMLGLAILATAFGLATYFVVSALWKVSVLWKRHRRLRR